MHPRIICVYLLAITLGACSSTTQGIFREVLDSNFLWEQYEQIDTATEHSHEVVLQILSRLHNKEKTEYIVPFLFEHMQKFPENPYRSYYTYLVAQSYVERGEYELACIYARRAVTSDISIGGISVQQQSLGILTQYSSWEWEQSRALLAKNSSDTSTNSEKAENLYRVAQLYNSMGRWEEMYQTYLDYLSLEEKTDSVQYKQVLYWVARYNSDRSWTFESLDTLIANIQSALAQKNVSNLLQHRAKDSFFTMSWNQELFDENSSIRMFNILPFLRRSSVRYSQQIAPISNEKEAYLRTWGWSYRIPTWYFYFKKVYFPADSTVHGNWEWAGIFFGDIL